VAQLAVHYSQLLNVKLGDRPSRPRYAARQNVVLVDMTCGGKRPVRSARRLAIIAMLVIAAVATGSQAAAETLIIQGSTTFYRRLVEPVIAARGQPQAADFPIALEDR
jgi:hypothetical protein